MLIEELKIRASVTQGKRLKTSTYQSSLSTLIKLVVRKSKDHLQGSNSKKSF